jgi:hypothetical protein
VHRRSISPALVIALLALFVSLGGTAWAATGGNFLLGKANTANAKSGLTATNAGPALQLNNTKTTFGATALGLNVAAGHPPFTTNSAATVANLSADKLDGYDASQLMAQADLVWAAPGTFTGKQTQFFSHGGPVLISVNGSAYGDVAGAVLQVCAFIDGVNTGSCGEISENEAYSHKALVPLSPGLYALSSGLHTITLAPSGNFTAHTFSDAYDVYQVTILELHS